MGLFSGLGDVPILGDVVNELRGNPDEIKAAYDRAMGKNRAQTEQLKQFMLGQQGKALAFYGPMQSMFQSMYGTQGIQSPQVPQVPGSMPLRGGR